MSKTSVTWKNALSRLDIGREIAAVGFCRDIAAIACYKGKTM
jgi:hypothetical protein